MDRDRLWWIIGGLVSLVLAVVTVLGRIAWHWQMNQDGDIVAVENVVTEMREERHGIIQKVTERDLLQDKEIDLMQQRLDRHDRRIGYLERRGRTDSTGVDDDRW